MRRVVLVIFACASFAAGCKRDKVVAVLGFPPGQSCAEFAEIAFPLHQNYKMLASNPEFTGLQFGNVHLTKAALHDACEKSRTKSAKGMDRWIHVATSSGTPLTFELYQSGYNVGVQSWIIGLTSSNINFSAIIDGKLVSSKNGKDVDSLIRGVGDVIAEPTLAKLGTPLFEGKPNKYSKEDAKFWRAEDLLVCRGCGGIIRVRKIRPFVEEDLKDSPDVERLLQALRDDGVKDL